MNKKKFLSAVISAAMMMSASVSSLGFVNSADDGVMRDMTTMELVRDMGVGINLGNTLESCGDWIAQWGAGGFPSGTVSAYETAWGSPVITQNMIKGYAIEGFGVVRVPVAWSNLMGDNYKINDEYFARVKQIVDWIIEEDMYAIINIHYDSGWLRELPNNPDGCKNRFKVMWEQIADYFKDYSDYLMFESQNEELGWDSIWNQWSGTAEQKAKSYAYVNEVNQLFVDTVRASGGNNDERHLLISGYKTDIALTCDQLFEMPDDPANRSAVSVHYYTPAGFAILEEDADWAECRETWGTEADFAELETNMELMKTTYIDKGIPVIIGEYGCPKDLKNGDTVVGQKDPESVRLFLSSVCQEAYERKLCPVLWDITDLHYDRDNYVMFDQELRAKFNEISGFRYDPESTLPTQPTEPPTEEREYTEADTTFTKESYGWPFDAKDADAVKFTLKSDANAYANGVVGWNAAGGWEQINWEGEFDANGTATVIVDLPKNISGAQVQCHYSSVWDNSIGDLRDAVIEMDSVKLLYYKEVTTDPTEPATTTQATTTTTLTTTETPTATTVTTTTSVPATTKAATTQATTTTITTTSTPATTKATTTQVTTVTTKATTGAPVVTTTAATTTKAPDLPTSEIGIPSMIGDVDCDNELGTSDIVRLAKYISSKSMFPLKDSTAAANADVNHDKKIDSTDTLKLIEYHLRKITSLV